MQFFYRWVTFLLLLLLPLPLPLSPFFSSSLSLLSAVSSDSLLRDTFCNPRFRGPSQMFRSSLTFTGTGSHGGLLPSWKDNTSGHKQFMRFLECIDNFFTQVEASCMRPHTYEKRRGILGMWRSKSSVIAVTMKSWSSRSWGEGGG